MILRLAEECYRADYESWVRSVTAVENGAVRAIAPMMSKDADIQPLPTWDEQLAERELTPTESRVLTKFQQMFFGTAASEGVATD